MGFELHVFLGRSGNFLGHDLALLRIQLERCRDLCHNVMQLVVGHTLVMQANSIELRQTAFVQEQEQKIPKEWGRLGALKMVAIMPVLT